MENKLPIIQFNKSVRFGIEIGRLEQFFSRLNQIKNHNPFAPHKIEFYFIVMVTKNSYAHFVDFQSYELNEGSMIFVAKNQVHHFNKDSFNQAEGFYIAFDHLFVDKHYFLTDNLRLNRLFNYHIESPIIIQREADGDNLIELTAHLHQEFIFPNNFAKTEILASILRVLLLKAERTKEVQSTVNVKAYWLETFSKFKDLLEKEYVNTRNSRIYASKLFVSYKFLNDVVKKLTGKTVKTFINDFVIIEIKRYLISTSLSINEISYQTGFEEPANMIKFFKKSTDTTPHKFRQQL